MHSKSLPYYSHLKDHLIFSGASSDRYLWKLAKEITSEQDFRDLGLNVLKLPGNTVNLALANKRDIDLAAHQILEIWFKQYESREEACENLVSSLKKCGMNQRVPIMF